jgi:hypothetical protein
VKLIVDDGQGPGGAPVGDERSAFGGVERIGNERETGRE